MGTRVRKSLFVIGVLLAAGALLAFAVNATLLSHSVTTTGYLEPETVAQLNFGAQAPIVELDVRPGDQVHRGQVLARQDTTALQAKLMADQATLAADNAMVAEAASPPSRPSVLQQLAAQVSAAQAELNAAKAKVNDTTSLDGVNVSANQNAVTAAEQVAAADKAQAASLAGACAAALNPTTSVPVGTTTSLPLGIAGAARQTVQIPTRRTTTTTSSTTIVYPTSVGTAPLQAPTTIPLPTVTTTPSGGSGSSGSSGSSSNSSLASSCVQLTHQVAIDAQAVVQAQGAVDLANSTRQLDSDTLSAAVSVASAQVQLAQANQAVGAVPPSAATVAADQANVAKDNAAVAADQAAITASTITAPADGIVGSVGGVVGDVASQDGVRNFTLTSSIPQAASSGIQIFPQAPTQSTSQPAAYNPAVTLDSTQVKVVAQISETDVQSLRANQRATITIPALSGTSLHASVERVEPQPVNQGGKVYFVIDLRLSSAPSEIGATQQVSLARADGSTTSWNLVGLTADISL